MNQASQLILFLSILIWNGAIAQEHREITLCWDVSYSMRNRDLDKENDYLQRYFSQHPDVSLTLLLFSNSVWSAEQFEIQSGNWTALRNRLEALPHDGATSYRELPAYAGSTEILLFTDGKQNMDDTTPVFDGRLYIVNSNPEYNVAKLNLLTLLNQGELIQLAERRPGPAETSLNTYFGSIYGNFPDNASLSLRIKGREQAVYHPDSLGNFSIPALPGEVLLLRRNADVAAEQVLGVGRNLNIWIEDSGEIRLDEVVVTESPGKEEDIQVQTSLGLKDNNAIGYQVDTVSDEQISDVATTASRAIAGKVSGVSLGQNDDLSKVEMRTKWSILSNNYGLIVVDGVPMARSTSGSGTGANNQNMGFIDPKNIANITVLKGLVATNRYGSAGANGVILITTKTASFSKPEDRKPKDLALLKDNVYDGKIKVSREMPTTAYINELKGGRSIAEAYDIYVRQRPRFEDKEAYFIDVSEYFRQAGPDLAFRILTSILDKTDAGRPALRTLLFKARELDKGELEYQVAQRLMEEYPDKIQSYLDLARAQQSTGNFQLALNMLLAMLNGSAQPELDFTPLKKAAERDLVNLVFRHAGKLDLSRLPAGYKSNLQYSARISVEWNNPGAAFELQFVNPQKRFFTWAHGQAADGRRLQSELEHGYSREEFEIYGQGVQGEWIINVKHNGSENGTTPVFLSCTVIQDFGKPGQHAREYTLRLEEQGSESQLAKIKLE